MSAWKKSSAASALAFIEAVLASPTHGVLVASERHAAIARELIGLVPGLAGNLMHDFHTAVLMREHGLVRVYTRDADFRRFPFLEVIDPLQPPTGLVKEGRVAYTSRKRRRAPAAVRA